MTDLALDIGGANIKAAWRNRSGLVTRNVPFALWAAPDELPGRLRSIIDHAAQPSRILLTMTAELCDCFETKRDGVCHVLSSVTDAARGCDMRVWSTEGRWYSHDTARDDTLKIAAANWHAAGTYLARRFEDMRAVWLDVGSTTTDIILLADGAVRVTGLTDTDRLASGELLYQGGSRTPLMAVAQRVPFGGRDSLVMAERFADMRDVAVLLGHTGELEEEIDTCDGRPLSRRCCAARVARTIGGDLDTMTEAHTIELAAAFARAAADRLHDAVDRVAQRFDAPPQTLLLSGSGTWLARMAIPAERSNLRVIDLADELGADASAAVCAVALLELAEAMVR